MDTYTETISFMLTPAEKSQLERLMAILDCNRSAAIRAALRQLADRYGVPPLDAIRPSLDRARPPQKVRKNGETLSKNHQNIAG